MRLRGGKVVNVGDNTLHVRLAGIDAPECAHWGKEAQFHGEESKEWLRSRLEGQFVKVKLLRRDQYERVVGRTWVRRWWGGWGDLGLEMVQRGMACVYEGSYGAEFGGMEDKYRKAEKAAKKLRVGMWKHGGTFSGESPAELKRKYKEVAEAKES
ncbi:staphylococcal nuclease, partial [Ascobolus immersus RN42]